MISIGIQCDSCSAWAVLTAEQTRRLRPELYFDHPEMATTRGTVIYWNFLPPNELENILKLYGKVSHKTLKISKRHLVLKAKNSSNLKTITMPSVTLHIQYRRHRIANGSDAARL